MTERPGSSHLTNRFTAEQRFTGQTQERLRLTAQTMSPPASEDENVDSLHAATLAVPHVARR